MNAHIFLGGEEYRGKFEIDTSDIVVSCDRAFKYLNDKNIKPDIVLGDFDSLGYYPENAEIFPVEKDFTDFELAIDKISKIGGIDKIFVYCGGGGRDDHFLCNIGIMLKAFDMGLNVEFITNFTRSFIAQGDVSFNTDIGRTVSVIPLFDAQISSSDGLKYEYKDRILNFSSSLGLSNIATKNIVKLSVINGRIIIFIVYDELEF